MSLKSFFASIWNAIKGIFNNLDEKTKTYTLQASQIVENIKTAIDSPMVDLLSTLIPGDWDKDVIDKVREQLPNILHELKLVNDSNQPIETILQQALQQIKFSSDDAKATFYLGLASMLLKSLSDGKLTISEAQDLVKYAYHEFVKR